jgi:hypothetical protein
VEKEVLRGLKEALDFANGQITETCANKTEIEFWSGYVKVLEAWINAIDLPNAQHVGNKYQFPAELWGKWKGKSDVLTTHWHLKNWCDLIETNDQEYILHRRDKILQGRGMIGAAIDRAMAFYSNR